MAIYNKKKKKILYSLGLTRVKWDFRTSKSGGACGLCVLNRSKIDTQLLHLTRVTNVFKNSLDIGMSSASLSSGIYCISFYLSLDFCPPSINFLDDHSRTINYFRPTDGRSASCHTLSWAVLLLRVHESCFPLVVNLKKICFFFKHTSSPKMDWKYPTI